MLTQPPLLPIFLKLAHHPCLVVGGGMVATQKVCALLECDADITVVSPSIRDEIREAVNRGRARWIAREYRREDISGMRLVIAATSDIHVNHAVHHDAGEQGVLVNAVDDPPFCDFYFSSVVRRGPLQIAISTGGESPALAQRLREEVSEALPANIGGWLSQLGRLRREVLQKQAPGEERNRLLKRLARRDLCESDNCPSRQLARGEGAKSESWWLT